MDWHFGRLGECPDQAASNGLLAASDIYGRRVRQKRAMAVRNRSAHVSGGARSVQRKTRQCRRAACHRTGKPGEGATGRNSLYSARQRAGDSPTGSRQRNPGERGCEGSGGGGEGPNRSGEGTGAISAA